MEGFQRVEVGMIAVEPVALSVKTAAVLTELSETLIREAINKQTLPARRAGPMIRVSRADLEEWFTALPLVGETDS